MHSRLLAGALVMAAAVAAAVHAQQAADQTAQRARWMTELSNWGRWGRDDTLGTINLITQAKRQQAMALAKTGTVVSLARDIVEAERSPAIRADGRPDGNPFFEITFRTFPPGDRNAGFSSDVQSFAIHGGTLTHLDGLCHNSYQGRMYNGFPLAETVDQEQGCTKFGIQALKHGIVTRGLLIDFPRLKGVSSLQPGARLTAADMEAWETQTGIRASAGDAIFLYNGRREGQQGAAAGGGFDLSIAPWLKARDIALVGSDRGNADHVLTLVAMGVYLLDNAGLDAVADAAVRLGRWEFMLVVAPIPAPNATGSIVNPLAIF